MKNGDLDADIIFNRLLIGYVHNVPFLILGTLSKLWPSYAPSANYSTYWTLPAMSQSGFPEDFPFALDASFLPCAPGLVCHDPEKMPPCVFPPFCLP
jgi:hypothetical protein